MDIPEEDLLAKAVENQPLVVGSEDDVEAAIRTLIGDSEIVFGLYPDRSDRGFNYTVIKGAAYLDDAASMTWNVIPVKDANALDDLYDMYGD
jgi:hypothetical protein